MAAEDSPSAALGDLITTANDYQLLSATSEIGPGRKRGQLTKAVPKNQAEIGIQFKQLQMATSKYRTCMTRESEQRAEQVCDGMQKS
jgi:hypothetical protein